MYIVHGLFYVKSHWLVKKVKGLRGYYTPDLKFACFVCYIKIINTILKNKVCIWSCFALQNFNAILSSLDNLLKDAYIIFQKSVDNFEIEHKTC